MEWGTFHLPIISHAYTVLLINRDTVFERVLDELGIAVGSGKVDQFGFVL